jgi:hypothetical protein
MNNFSYYSITGQFKQTQIPFKNPEQMVQHIEHFESFENYDPIEDKLVMVYKETDIKIVDKDSAKKLIEKYLQK